MKFVEAKTLVELQHVYSILVKLGEIYPNFSSWYWDKVIPSVVLYKSKVILGYSKNNLVGVSIIKKDKHENKIRALRISDEYQKKGYGLYLIDHSLKVLEDDKPLVSVNQNMINEFSRIFINRYNFDLTFVHKSLYIQNELEYQFNGNKQSLINKSIYF